MIRWSEGLAVNVTERTREYPGRKGQRETERLGRRRDVVGLLSCVIIDARYILLLYYFSFASYNSRTIIFIKVEFGQNRKTEDAIPVDGWQ